jgi:hypothetical protein
LTALGLYDEIRGKYSKPAEPPIQEDFDPIKALEKVKQILGKRAAEELPD